MLGPANGSVSAAARQINASDSEQTNPGLSVANAVRLWAGGARDPVNAFRASVAGPRRKLRRASQTSKTVGLPNDAPEPWRATKVDHGRRARSEALPEPVARGWLLRAQHESSSAPPVPTTRSHKIHCQEIWHRAVQISLTDRFQLRRMK